MIRERPPSEKEAEQSLNELERKLGWIAFFTSKGGRGGSERYNPKLHVPSKRQAKHNPDVARFMRHLSDDVRKDLKQQLEKDKYIRHVNKSSIDKLAEQELRKGEIVVMEADKDGCWVITNRAGYAHLENEIIDGPSYNSIATEQIDTKEIKKAYERECKTLSK